MSYAKLSHINNLSYFNTPFIKITSSIISLFGAKKLTGENYAIWKNTINTVLVINDHKFVITKKCSPAPGSNVAKNVRDAYDRWIKVNDNAKVYILAGLTEVLAKKHETMINAREIIESLHNMFRQLSTHIKHDALSSSSMPGWTRDHSLESMSLTWWFTCHTQVQPGKLYSKNST